MKLKNIIKENIQTLQEAKFDQPTIAYHGTSSEYLNTILSQGLIPKKNAGWGSGLGGDITKRSLDAIGGVYFTTDLRYAQSATNPSEFYNSLYVIASLQPKSFFEDEDNIITGFERPLREITSGGFGTPNIKEAFRIYYYMLTDHQKKSSLLKAVYLRQPEKIQSLLSQNTRSTDVLEQFILHWSMRVLAYAKKEQRSLEYKLSDELRTMSTVDRSESLNATLDILDEIPDPQTAERLYAKVIEQLTIMLKRLAYAPEQEGKMFRSFRIDSPISYRGNNKIISIVEADPDDKELIVHYGRFPSSVMRDFEMFYPSDEGWEWVKG